MNELESPGQNRKLGSDVRRLVAPMVIAAVLRLGLMIAAFMLTGTSVMTQGDTLSYLIPGRNLIVHGAYVGGGLPEIDRTPGYPLFVMLAGMVFDNVLLVVVVQVALSLVSLWLVWRIASRVFPNSAAGLIAAWMYAAEPVSLLYAARLMPETLFVVLLLAVIDRLVVFLSSERLRAAAVAGLLLAAATYVRPVSYYLVVPLALGLALVAPKVRGYWWKAPVVLVLSVVPLLGVWQIRNFVETGYGGFSSIVEKNLYFYQAAEITAEVEHLSLAEEQDRLGYLSEDSYVAAHPEQRDWSQAQRLKFIHGEAVRVLAENRGRYLRSHLAGVGVVAFTPCAAEWLQMLGVYPDERSMPHRILNEGILVSIRRIASEHAAVFGFMAGLEMLLLVLYVLAIKGCLKGNSGGLVALLVGVVLYFLLIAGGAQAIGRYRLPVMPMVCVLAGGGLVSWDKRKQDSI